MTSDMRFAAPTEVAPRNGAGGADGAVVPYGPVPPRTDAHDPAGGPAAAPPTDPPPNGRVPDGAFPAGAPPHDEAPDGSDPATGASDAEAAALVPDVRPAADPAAGTAADPAVGTAPPVAEPVATAVEVADPADELPTRSPSDPADELPTRSPSDPGDEQALSERADALPYEPLSESADDLPTDPAAALSTGPVDDLPTGPVGEVTAAGPIPDEVVAAEVADRLGAVVGEDVEADPAEFAAAAVLDVLRASGWADAAEAAELRAEAGRTRELLNMVVRDHRAREASMAGTENQQLYWLVPLLRAAHGVAFGSLGAKVALRTAVQDVPPDVLAQAGLRIDYGVEHAAEAEHGEDFR